MLGTYVVVIHLKPLAVSVFLLRREGKAGPRGACAGRQAAVRSDGACAPLVSSVRCNKVLFSLCLSLQCCTALSHCRTTPLPTR